MILLSLNQFFGESPKKKKKKTHKPKPKNKSIKNKPINSKGKRKIFRCNNCEKEIVFNKDKKRVKIELKCTKKKCGYTSIIRAGVYSFFFDKVRECPKKNKNGNICMGKMKTIIHCPSCNSVMTQVEKKKPHYKTLL